MKYMQIRKCEKEYPVQAMAHVLGVSRSGYYSWRNSGPSNRSKRNVEILREIRSIHEEMDATYGSPRMHEELRDRNFDCGRHRVARLMSKNNIFAIQKRKFCVTTDSNHDFVTAENLLGRDFSADECNEKWAGDITYIPTEEGWLYLSVVMDLFSRRIIGWSTSKTLERGLVLDALKMAIIQRGCASTVFHSDRGVQYASEDFQRLLKKNDISCSMSRTGDCWDNAMVESFFHTLKVERVNRRKYRDRAHARRDIFEYIERFYNRKRKHSAIGYMNPVQFEEARIAA